MSSEVIWLALGAGAASGLVGGLMSFRKDRWITFVIAIGAGMLGGILSNRLLMLTEARAPRVVVIGLNGATRAELGVSEDSAYLKLMDRGGNERLRMDGGSGSHGPCILFKDAREKSLVAFCVRGDSATLLDLRGQHEKLLWSSDPAAPTSAGPASYPVNAGVKQTPLQDDVKTPLPR